MTDKKPKDIKGTTKTGFEYVINEETLDNYELIEVLAEVDENPLRLPRLLVLLVGEEQKDALKEHVRTPRGTVPAQLLRDEIADIFRTKIETKN